MNRRGPLVVAALVVMSVLSSCSVREVQLWFQINRGVSISRAEARNLADLVNSKKPAGECDGNYAGGCVPNNQSVVHCAGTTGEGPVVHGPLSIVGWDSFELDPDGDKVACPANPIGALDYIGQRVTGITVSGWAFDPDSADPIQVHVYDGTTGIPIAASDPRTDLAGSYPGVGTNHGFTLHFAAGLGAHNVCAYAINVAGGGNTLLGCKNVVVGEVGVDGNDTQAIVALLEQADRTPAGMHISGFAYEIGDVDGVFMYVATPDAPLPIPFLDLTPFFTVNRADVNFIDPSAPLNSGFDFTIPAQAFPNTSARVCVGFYFPAESAGETLSCRTPGT